VARPAFQSKESWGSLCLGSADKDRLASRSIKILSTEDLLASFSYQAGEVVLYVVNEVIGKDVKSALGVSYLIVKE
jgi:hypothetical protein